MTDRCEMMVVHVKTAIKICLEKNKLGNPDNLLRGEGCVFVQIFVHAT